MYQNIFFLTKIDLSDFAIYLFIYYFIKIKAGYEALKRISDCIDKGKKSGGEITQACNDFYTRIPHEFGFRVRHLF